MAVEGVGFEPTKPFRAPDLQSGGLNHSPTPPRVDNKFTMSRKKRQPTGNAVSITSLRQAGEGTRTHQPADYKSAALPLRHSGMDNESLWTPNGDPGAAQFSIGCARFKSQEVNDADLRFGKT